jgi:hypothetical protein
MIKSLMEFYRSFCQQREGTIIFQEERYIEMSEKINALQSGDVIYFEISAVTGGKQKIKAVARFTIE